MKRLHLDLGLTLVILSLTGMSLALIWSINPDLLITQLIFFISGFALYFLFSQLDSKVFYHLAKYFYFLSITFLIISLLGSRIRGVTRWIEIFGFRMQPSELIKPFIIISFAYFMAQIQINNLFSFLKSLIIYLSPIMIIFLQPDLGNMIIYTFFLVAMIFANQTNLKKFIIFFLLIILSSPFFWYLLRDYQKQRILSFLSPQADPYGTGYNAIQSMIAVGSGKFFGLGLGRGTQSHLRFLPENHTDFIFASLSEELGLLGALLLLMFYGYIFFRILKSASNIPTKFNYLIMIGTATQIFAQVFINIAMNIGILPITGVTLPLISFGGSSILATFISLGIIVSLQKEEKSELLVIR